MNSTVAERRILVFLRENLLLKMVAVLWSLPVVSFIKDGGRVVVSSGCVTTHF